MPSSMIVPFIVLQIVTVVAIVMFLRMLLHKQLEIGLKRIKKMDKDNLDKEVILNDNIRKLNEEYDKKLEDAERQADVLISMAKDDSKKLRDSERIKAKEEAKKIIASALEERDRISHQTKSEIARKAIDLSVTLLKRVFSEKELKAVKIGSVKDSIDIMIESGSIGELIKKGEDIEIITSDDLTPRDKKYILASIEKHSGNKKNVKFNTEKNILGGLILKIGESIIDSGFETRIIRAAKEMKEEI